MDETAIALGTDYAIRTQAEIREMIIVLEDLASIQRIRSGSDKTKIIEAMAENKVRIKKFLTIFFIFPDGSGVRFDGSTGDYTTRDYFKKVLATQKPVVSEPLVSNTTGKLSVILAVPVFNNGQLTGVLCGTYSLESFSEMMKNLKFKETGYGFVADASGTVIAHPTMPEIVGKMKLNDKKINSELKLQQTELDDRLINLFKTAADTGKPAQGKYRSVNGVDSSAVMVPIELPNGMRWVMVVAAPETEFTREAGILAKTMFGVSLLFTIIAVIFIFVWSKRMVEPIKIIRDECLLLTEGDLRERELNVCSKDEISQLAQGFITMRNHLRDLVGKVQSQAEQVAASSEELTASAQQSAEAANQVAVSIGEIATGTEKQGSLANHISTVAEQLSDRAEQSSIAAHEVSEIAISTTQEAEHGRLAVEKVIGQMEQIGRGSEAVQGAIKELADGSREISEIVTLISNIAGQTNLLALNAAIEAARAGEHGRGFAVVAEEVRKLAEESNAAARQIGELIGKNQLNMDQVVATTKTGAEGIRVGIEVVHSAGETFKKIVGSITRLSEGIKNISQTITDMADGNRKMLSSIREINQLSKENAVASQSVSAATEEQSASMEEIAASSQALAKMADELQDAVGKFKV